jgi:hypothetical protein
MAKGLISTFGILLKLSPLALVAGIGIYALQTKSVDPTVEKLVNENVELKQTINGLLGENTDLKQSITNLSEESQIGYAKVLSQETREGVVYTKLLFVATQPNQPLKTVVEKEYEVRGDVVHFDALIVKFGNSIVMDGRERAIYLWRRIYDETMEPQQGFPIEEEGIESGRYTPLCEKLSVDDKQLFWENIWTLSNDPNHLAELGVHAIYGNVVYQKLQPGLIYIFKISNTGSLYPETVPDL